MKMIKEAPRNRIPIPLQSSFHSIPQARHPAVSEISNHSTVQSHHKSTRYWVNKRRKKFLRRDSRRKEFSHSRIKTTRRKQRRKKMKSGIKIDQSITRVRARGLGKFLLPTWSLIRRELWWFGMFDVWGEAVKKDEKKAAVKYAK